MCVCVYMSADRLERDPIRAKKLILKRDLHQVMLVTWSCEENNILAYFVTRDLY